MLSVRLSEPPLPKLRCIDLHYRVLIFLKLETSSFLQASSMMTSTTSRWSARYISVSRTTTPVSPLMILFHS
uniref:Uncharacterized protein n=1 Tax=Aegilops tauschii subsp. strangulata TaxID=200361 RepID=A0A453K1U9_AEGTS